MEDDNFDHNAAARELLYRYHQRLLDGCGSPICSNQNCASSGQVSNTMSSNEAAALAIRLMFSKAQICPPYSSISTSALSSPFNSVESTGPAARHTVHNDSLLSPRQQSNFLSNSNASTSQGRQHHVVDGTSSDAPPASSSGGSSGEARRILERYFETNRSGGESDVSGSQLSFILGDSNDSNHTRGIDTSVLRLPDLDASPRVGSNVVGSRGNGQLASHVPESDASSDDDSQSALQRHVARYLNQINDSDSDTSGNAHNRLFGAHGSFLSQSPRPSPRGNYSGDSPDVPKAPPRPKRKLPDSDVLTEKQLLLLIEQCKVDGDFKSLRRTLGEVLCNAEAMNQSFLRVKSQKVPSVLTVDSDKDIDTTEPQPMDTEEVGSQEVDTTPLADDELSLDLDSARRGLKQLFGISHQPFTPVIANGITHLCDNAELDLKFHNAYEADPDYLNLFFILLELFALDEAKGDFFDHAFPAFCRAFVRLPVKGQAKMVRVLANASYFETSRLAIYLRLCQQLITMCALKRNFTKHNPIQEDAQISNAVLFMRCVYYSNLIIAQREALQDDTSISNFVSIESSQDRLEHLQHEELDNLLQKSTDRVVEPFKIDLLAQELGSINAHGLNQLPIPLCDFVNETVAEIAEMDIDYLNKTRDKFSFMVYPFILPLHTRVTAMFYDNRISMMSERRQSAINALYNDQAISPYLKLYISRDSVVHDALSQLEMYIREDPQELRKQLYVVFHGENGIDEGGLSKEFYQLVTSQLFNLDYGMFVYNETTRLYWFASRIVASPEEYMLIGVLFGLAIYNSLIVDVQFPNVLYRKLYGCRGDFSDLNDYDPVIYASMKHLLDHDESIDGSVEDVYCLTFQISFKDQFGHEHTHGLIPGGAAVPVTGANKKEYVARYVDYLLNDLVDKPFRAFWRGFHTVMLGSSLTWFFLPGEVDQLVCGSKEDYDFGVLAAAADYDNGFNTSHIVIKWFWECVNEMTVDEQRLLLQFVTGSDRVPVGGMAKLKFIIAKNGDDESSLPTAHTCFNVLLMPEYSSKEKLKERLLKAISYSRGFGLM